MRRGKWYFMAILILLVCFILHSKEFVFSSDIRGGNRVEVRSELWNGLIANSVNQRKIYLTIDGKDIPLNKGDIYMNENLNLMLPTSLLTDTFNCSARFYNGQTLVVEQNNLTVQMELGGADMRVNGVKKTADSPLVMDGDTLYVAAEALAKALDCKYNWDIATNSAMISINSDHKKLPVKYDYRENLRDPSVKDQGTFGTCWAFASLTALESSLLPEENLDFSEDHMSLQNSFSSNQNDGGEYTMAMAYLTSWQGPVLEKDDPYGDRKSPDNLNAVKHVQEIQVIGAKDFETIKEMVFKYGGVQSSLYTSLKNSESRSQYYNKDTYSYCYIGTQKPNHDVVIIGWDDNYPKENFTMDIEADGAFICRNSWGERFGDRGTFYVSYYDTNIGVHNVVFTGVENTDNYNKIYQTDLCGWVGQLGYVREQAYFSNVYTAETEERLAAVGFYATGKDTKYEIYMVHDFNGVESFNNREFIMQGSIKNAGFYTVEFPEEIPLRAKERFAVIVKINTPNSERPIAIEYAADSSTKDVILTDGEGYTSLYGRIWENTESTQNCNICLKAYTHLADGI